MELRWILRLSNVSANITVMMAAAMFSETLDKSQYSPYSHPKTEVLCWTPAAETEIKKYCVMFTAARISHLTNFIILLETALAYKNLRHIM